MVVCRAGNSRRRGGNASVIVLIGVPTLELLRLGAADGGGNLGRSQRHCGTRDRCGLRPASASRDEIYDPDPRPLLGRDPSPSDPLRRATPPPPPPHNPPPPPP